MDNLCALLFSIQAKHNNIYGDAITINCVLPVFLPSRLLLLSLGIKKVVFVRIIDRPNVKT